MSANETNYELLQIREALANLPSLLSSAISTTSGAFQVYMAAGWSPVLGLADDGTYYYIQVKDWVGGTGTKPLVGQYLSTAGWTNNIASASRIAIVGGGIPDGDKGDITVSGGGGTWTVDARAITAAKLFEVGATRLLGRHAGTAGNAQEVGLDGGLEFHGGNIRREALTGDVTASAGSNSTTITPAANPSWITSLALNKLTQSGATTGQVAQWNGTAWVPATSSAGKVLNIWPQVLTTPGSSTNPIPFDNTIPQITEGEQLFAWTITPSSASSKLIVEWAFTTSFASISSGVVALFVDGAVNAVAAMPISSHFAANIAVIATGKFIIDSWTGAKAVTLRAGNQSGSIAFRWLQTPTAIFGTAHQGCATITEVTV